MGGTLILCVLTAAGSFTLGLLVGCVLAVAGHSKAVKILNRDENGRDVTHHLPPSYN